MKNIHDNLLYKALDIAKEAGKVILEVYNTNFKVSYKQDQSPLTIADKRSHKIIVTKLKELTPQFPILSEEGKDIPYEVRRQWEYFWLVDPIDGTKEFINRNGEFTVNIALIEKNRPVLGIIYVPVKNILYYAQRGKGAFKLEGEKLIRLRVNKNISKNGYRVIISRSHATREVDDFLKDISIKEKISAGSSLKFCLVAEGRADIYPRFSPTMEWDTAAGQAIVEQTRGKVISFETSTPLKYNKVNLLNPWFIATKATLKCNISRHVRRFRMSFNHF